MWPLGVVVANVDPERVFGVTAAKDQRPVEVSALREDLVEGAAVLAVAIADLEAHAAVGEVEAEVRACCVNEALVGFVVRPASQTRRLPGAMKNSA